MGIPKIPKANASAAPAATTAPVATAAPTPTPTAAPTAAPAAAATPVAPVPTSAPAPAPVPAVRGSTAVALRQADPLQAVFKDAFPVEWNTCHRLQATNGNICDVEANKAPLGAVFMMELMSYQDNHQISPGTNNKDDAELVRYSNDGITTTKGENCAEYLQALLDSGRLEAKMGHRCTLAGLAIGGTLDGELVQIDLPPTSKSLFDRFRMQVTADVKRGKRVPDEAKFLKLTAKPTTKGNNTWTLVEFTYAYEPGQHPKDAA